MKIAKQILGAWGRECLGRRLTIDVGDDTYASILLEEWNELIVRIDVALREARQEGLDFKKQKKLLNEEYEFGPFWSKFYLNGGLDLPGLAEAFDCTRDEPTWLNQWNEVIRIAFKKPTLRAVDPDEVVRSLKSGMSEYDWNYLDAFVTGIIQGLARDDEVQENQPRWSIAALKGK